VPGACALHKTGGAEAGKAALAPVQGVGVLVVLVDGALASAPAITEGGVIANRLLAPVGIDPAKGIG